MQRTIVRFLGMSTLLTCIMLAQERTFSAPAPCPRVIKDAPYSGDTTLDNEQTARDGSPLSHRVVSRKIYRDREGRVRTEEPLKLGSTAPGATLLITIQDCGAGVEYTLDTRSRIAHRFTFSAARPIPKNSVSPPVASATTYQATNENLGTQTIEGVLVEGRRDTLSYPAGTWGYDRPFKTVHEVWISKELGVIVRSRSSLPAEDLISKLTNISRLEPDPLLFVVPADYTIVDEKGPFTIKY